MKMTIAWKEEPRETEVHIISYKKPDEETKKLMAFVKQGNKILVAYDDKRIHKLAPNEVFYIDSVDDKTFLYTHLKVYESKQKLYELEQTMKSAGFTRISKGVIININHILSVKPLSGGRLEACLANDEKQIVNRHYVANFRRSFGLTSF